jgi:hypothetical protein
MPEVVGNDGVNICEIEGVVGADQIFRSHAVLVLLDHQIETNTTLADADGTPFVHAERGRFGGKR